MDIDEVIEVMETTRRPTEAFLEFATIVVMKKRAAEYREERKFPEYVDLGGEGG